MVLLNNKWNIFCRGLLLFSYCLTPLNKNRSFASSVPMCMYFAFGRVKTKDWLCFNFQILFDLSVFCSLTERITLQIGLWPARCQARNKWELSGSDWVFPLICFISTGPPRVVLWPPGFTVIHYILSVVIYSTGKSFQLAIIAPRINLIGYDTATVQNWSALLETLLVRSIPVPLTQENSYFV